MAWEIGHACAGTLATSNAEGLLLLEEVVCTWKKAELADVMDASALALSALEQDELLLPVAKG